jgi:NYN domain
MKPDRPRDRRPPRRIALFIDFGGFKALLASSPDSPPVSELAIRLRNFAASLGRVVTLTAYADWTGFGDDARAFQSIGIEPRLVLRSESGEDRSDVVMSLDVLEKALTVPAISMYVIASVDANLEEIATRLRGMGREVVVCGPQRETASELVRSADRFVPFEVLKTPPTENDAPADADEEVAESIEFASYDWTKFLRLVDELEGSLSFVGLKYLHHKVLNRKNCGFDDRGRRQILITHAIDVGILQVYQIDNIESAGDPVSACRLNRENEVVLRVCGKKAPSGPRSGRGTSRD